MTTYLAAAATGFARPTGRDGGGGSMGAVPPPALDLLDHYLLLELGPLSTGPWSKW
ncbi:hypothetical protein FRC05_001348 [Tulasnella sp. 425]|nr:hypothetical protein FRC05_001348 [Tulasnella sp. 425]